MYGEFNKYKINGFFLDVVQYVCVKSYCYYFCLFVYLFYFRDNILFCKQRDIQLFWLL